MSSLLPSTCTPMQQIESPWLINQLFNEMDTLFTFMNYNLLQNLISEFGNSNLKANMTSYEHEMQTFMTETTVCEAMPYWPIPYWPDDVTSETNFSLLWTKFSNNPKTYTLEKLNTFRIQLCSSVNLSYVFINLRLLEPSTSFYVAWSVPTAIVPKLTTAIQCMEETFFEEQNLLTIFLSEKELYIATQGRQRTHDNYYFLDSFPSYLQCICILAQPNSYRIIKGNHSSITRCFFP